MRKFPGFLSLNCIPMFPGILWTQITQSPPVEISPDPGTIVSKPRCRACPARGGKRLVKFWSAVWIFTEGHDSLVGEAPSEPRSRLPGVFSKNLVPDSWVKPRTSKLDRRFRFGRSLTQKNRGLL